ncbi:PREDICTED: zinc finger protein SNAI3-like [Nanorana parkeri]|uniref:zinc finger protein SNAI3-like n=1 Tax=Nanorana parkeri TaxID=125878 RepID=UPI000854821A|nr:PREDICTED: zinc finger protein SNAI3-like [Nanorana parkeri]
MPRSFLVKKPCSHRIPNYGQLLEAQPGLALSIYQSEDIPAVKQDITEKWPPQAALSHTEADTTQEELYNDSPLSPLEFRMGNALSVLTNGLPLKDSLNNLHTPPRSRTAEAGLSALVNKAAFSLPSQGEMAQVSDSEACLDFQKSGKLHSNHKLRHCRYFSCPHCSKAYSSLGALKMHIRTHTLPCACRICGKAFSRPWLLQGHIRTHTGEKPFSCYHCGRGFADRSNLRAHLQTHSEVKRYRCPGCVKTFSRISLLIKHRDGCCCPVS